MHTIRQYIKHQKKLPSQRDNHTQRTSKKQSSLTQKYSAFDQQKSLNGKSNTYPRKISLPPIPENSVRSKSIQLKRSIVLSRFFHNKSIIANVFHKRSKTEEQRIQKKSNYRSQLVINLQESKMRPMEKYSFQLENIRLAEKLLVVKPSLQTRRNDQKKFFLKQKHYRDQISRSYISMKSTRNQKKSVKKAFF